LRRAADVIAVTHPRLHGRRDAREQPAACLNVKLGVAVLAVRRRQDFAAEKLRHQLHAIADAEHRDAKIEHRRVRMRRAFFINRRRPARQDQAARLAAAQRFD
jgi:hypothetical protein